MPSGQACDTGKVCYEVISRVLCEVSKKRDIEAKNVYFLCNFSKALLKPLVSFSSVSAHEVQ